MRSQITAVPFRDLARVHAIGRDTSRASVFSALDSVDFQRPSRLIEHFESAWAEYCGVRHAVATSSGSTALLVSFMALGVGPGDEVLTVPNTFVATAEAALVLGAQVRLVDIDPATLAIDQELAIAMLTERTRAVVPLHPFGRFAELDRLRQACAAQDIALVEEACHAHGARRDDVMAGAAGDCGVFSFGPTKPLAGLGEGGAVVTDDDELAERMRQVNNHGRANGQHASVGLNFRIHPVEASYLTARLALYPQLVERRREIAGRYNDAFGEYGVTGNTDVAHLSEHSYYVYVLAVPQRSRFCERLTSAGVGWDVHYPVAIHRQPAHLDRFRDARLPRCDQTQQRIVSLPMYDGLTDSEVDYVIGHVRSALDELAS
ncbi:MAG: DegT/DnrJ/EryC1/StrS family aminotransferase [Jatrophihabitantaceae bacterium]